MRWFFLLSMLGIFYIEGEGKKGRLMFISNPFTHLIFVIYVILADKMAWYTNVSTDVFYI